MCVPRYRWQDHAGTAVSGDPAVEYAYEDDVSSGEAKYVRLDYVTYPGPITPSRRAVYYHYRSSGAGQRLSQLDHLADDASSTTKYAQYTYLGAASIVKLAYPTVKDGQDLPLTLTYDPDKNNTYGGLDDLGRVTDQLWRYQTSGSTGATVDHYTYGYDGGSRRTYRDSTQAEQDWKYDYDDLDRLNDARRGTFTASPPTFQAIKYRQEWEILEALGNWKDFNVDTNGDGSWELEQTREHNEANEIADTSSTPDHDAIYQGTGDPEWLDPIHLNSDDTVNPGYDRAGNMTSGPKPGAESTADQRQFCVYDAWNRLVEVWRDKTPNKKKEAEGPDEQLAEYRYDALHRRIRKVVKPGTDVTYDYYYNTSWQVVEVRREGATKPYKQYVWDLRYIDAPVVRFRDGDAANPPDGTLNDTLYYLHDANMNVTGLIHTNGTVEERYNYDPYGKVTFFTGSWASRSESSCENEILYCGYRYDLETKLYHVRHRYYHPTLGRWLQRDPLGYADGMSLYQYVGSNPVIYVDPMAREKRVGFDLQVDVTYTIGGLEGRVNGLFAPLLPALRKSVSQANAGFPFLVLAVADRFAFSDMPADAVGGLDVEGTSERSGRISGWTGIPLLLTVSLQGNAAMVGVLRGRFVVEGDDECYHHCVKGTLKLRDLKLKMRFEMNGSGITLNTDRRDLVFEFDTCYGPHGESVAHGSRRKEFKEDTNLTYVAGSPAANLAIGALRLAGFHKEAARVQGLRDAGLRMVRSALKSVKRDQYWDDVDMELTYDVYFIDVDGD